MNHLEGDIGENIAIKYIEQNFLGVSYIERAPNKRFPDWDLKVYWGLPERADSVARTYEVKYDKKAYYWMKRRKQETPNMYIEYENTKSGGHSGIMSSVADYYIYIFLLEDGGRELVLFERTDLLHWAAINQPDTAGNKMNGDDNANGWLFPLADVESIILDRKIL